MTKFEQQLIKTKGIKLNKITDSSFNLITTKTWLLQCEIAISVNEKNIQSPKQINLGIKKLNATKIYALNFNGIIAESKEKKLEKQDEFDFIGS